MKKYLFAIGSFILLSTAIHAQEKVYVMEERSERNGPGLIIGARFMPTISSIKVANSSGNSVSGNTVFTYGYGALIGLNFNNYIGLQLEGIYNTLSNKYNDQSVDRTIKINYINVPLLLSLNTNRRKMVNGNLVVGPQWGVNVGSSVSNTSGSGSSSAQAVLAVKKNDFGIAYGVGVDFGRTFRLDIGVRGVLGLMKVGDQSKTLDANSYYILQNKNTQTYQAYIGVLWVL